MTAVAPSRLHAFEPPEQPEHPKPAPARSRRDDIVVLAMNEGGRREIAALREVAHVDAILDEPVLDLRTREGIADHVARLGLSPDAAAQVTATLSRADPLARDELAQLASRWAEVERGRPGAGRLLLSGHSVGHVLFGEENGALHFDELGELARAMPRAAAAVEDLHLAACYTGFESGVERFRAFFPNLKTVWAYAQSAPGSDSGAIAHQRRWEAATRGAGTQLDREVARGTRKGESVAVWTRTQGYAGPGLLRALPDALAEVRAGAATVERHRLGVEQVADPQRGELRAHYARLQAALAHPALPAAEQRELEIQRDLVIRLLFYGAAVAPRFQAIHAAQLRRGYAAVRREPPDFGRLTRAEALTEISRFEREVRATRGGDPRTAAALRLLQEGLRDLQPALIPLGWL